MGTVIYDCDRPDRGIADFTKIDATTDTDIERQIAEDDAEAARDAALYAATRNEAAGSFYVEHAREIHGKENVSRQIQ